MARASFLGAFAAIGLLPCTAILLLVATGEARAGPGLLAFAATAAAAALVAALRTRDVALLADALRDAGETGPARNPTQAARAIKRLGRAHANRAAQSDALLAANEAIIERLPDPLLLLGPDRAVRRANAAARAAFGADMAAVLRHPGLRGAVERAYDGGLAQTAELFLAAPVAREVHATIIVMDRAPNAGATAIAVLSDRTRERAVERMRADFVANASHELRTPLASLIGFIDTLRGPAADDPPAQLRFLGIMAEQAQRMNRLIDDLLSLSRIELTEHQPPSEAIDLGALVREIAAGFEPRVGARNIRLELRVAPDLPAVIGDHDQMAQVLQNLIDNAVKYGREGGRVGVSAEIAAGERWPARPGVVLAVADEGPGIPRAHIPRLTERFYRVDKGRSRNAGGTGLGLAIVKHIVNRHRGQLAIDSEEGKGATFSVWLPAGAAKPGP